MSRHPIVTGNRRLTIDSSC